MRKPISGLDAAVKITDSTRLLIENAEGSQAIKVGNIRSLRSVKTIIYGADSTIDLLSLPVGNYRFKPGAEVISLPNSGYYSTVASADVEVFISGRSLRLTLWAYHTTKKEMWPFLFEYIIAADSGGFTQTPLWSLVGPTELTAANPGVKTTATPVTSVVK